jgi:hypothetical protein
MSTKNLARTVIEGGRYRWNRWQRRHSHSEHRVAQREALAGIRCGDPEDVVFEGRPGVRPQFRDKLSPAKRWLGSQVGRPWNLVRGELLRRFDTRTTPGRHIVFCHVFPWVEDSDFHFIRRDFRVDAHGVLRRVRPERYRGIRPPEPLPRPQAELERWLAQRRVGARGGHLFWFTLTPAGAFRQDRRLDDDDVRLWRSLPTWFREQHVPGAPGPWIKVN